MIDDVLGLVILAVVTGVNHAPPIAAARCRTRRDRRRDRQGAGFLVGALVLGVYVSPPLFSLASRLRGERRPAGASAWRSASCWPGSPACIGLAPIVGAFAAGLVLEDVHYRDFTDRGEHALEELIEPISVVPRPDLLRR